MGRAGVCTVALAAALAVVAAGCGTSRHTSPPGSPTVADAQRVDRLARAYLATYAAVAARVENRLNREYFDCPLTRSDPHGPPGAPSDQQFVVLHQAAILRAMLPHYRALARDVGRARRLRAASRAMLAVATAYRAIEHADTDYCGILRKWAAHAWRPRFDIAAAVDASILTRPPTTGVRKAYDTLQTTALALRGAGGSPRDINLLLRFTRLFWSPDA